MTAALAANGAKAFIKLLLIRRITAMNVCCRFNSFIATAIFIKWLFSRPY